MHVINEIELICLALIWQDTKEINYDFFNCTYILNKFNWLQDKK